MKYCKCGIALTGMYKVKYRQTLLCTTCHKADQRVKSKFHYDTKVKKPIEYKVKQCVVCDEEHMVHPRYYARWRYCSEPCRVFARKVRDKIRRS